MKSLLLSLLFLGLFCAPLWAASFSFDFNDQSTQLGFTHKLQSQSYGDTLVKARYLYSEETDTNLLGVAGGVLGSPGNVDGLKVGIDVALNGGETAHDLEFLAFGIGFLGEYSPPVLTGFGVNAHLVYSPEIFTFLDSESYIEWGLGASYQLLPNAKITLAYQNIQMDILNIEDHDLDETLRFGIAFTF